MKPANELFSTSQIQQCDYHPPPLHQCAQSTLRTSVWQVACFRLELRFTYTVRMELIGNSLSQNQLLRVKPLN